MKHQTALRGMTIALLLILSAILPAALPTAQAANPYAKTTFYYTDAYDEENLGDIGLPALSLSQPTNETDLYYPYEKINPVRDGFSLLYRYYIQNQSIDDFDNIDVLSQALLYYFAMEIGLDQLSGAGGLDEFSDLGDLGELEDLIDSYLLLLPHPLRLIQSYSYEGDEAFTIQGDLSYQLYFDSNTLVRKNDQITVGLYKMTALGIPIKIKETTEDLNTPTLGGTYGQTITLQNVDTTLNPGDIVLLSSEIQPGNKTLSNILTAPVLTNLANRLINGTINIILNNKNNTNFEFLSELATYIEEFGLTGDNATLPANLTTNLLASAINLLKSNRFIYGSTNYPASITIPTSIPGYDEQIHYYLNINNALTPTLPTTDQTSTVEITDTAQNWTTTINQQRNKIFTEASSQLYFTYTKLIPKTVEITASLYDGTTLISEDTQELRSTILPQQQSLSFSFNTQNYELQKEKSITLSLSLTNGTNPGQFSKVKLNFDSTQAPSNIITSYQETDNIKITSITENPSNGHIVPGDKIVYSLTIESTHSDSITLTTPIQSQNEESWTLTSNPETLSIQANGNETVTITLQHNDNTKEAYDQSITFTIIAAGNTGIDKTTTSAQTSTSAIDYDIDIIAYTNETIQAKKGEQAIFRVKIKNNNTGAIDDQDSYNVDVVSQNNWNLTYDDEIKSLTRLSTKELIIAIDIPKETDEKTDQLSFTISSQSNSQTTQNVTFTLSVVTDSIQEGLYESLKDIADDLGLTDLFGEDAPLILISIIVLIVFLFLIIIVMFLKQKTFTIHLPEAMQDIKAKEHASYHLDVENTTKQTRTYNIKTEPKQAEWSAEAQPPTLKIDGHQAETSVISVTPPEKAKNEDWAEVVITITEDNKKNAKQLSTLTTINDKRAKQKNTTPKPTPKKENKSDDQTAVEHAKNSLLKLTNIYSWPEEFYENERIVTSIRCENYGEDDAEDVDIILYINGKQKNKVTIDIPAGGYADIKLPWIAAKGKNKLYIRAKEKKQ